MPITPHPFGCRHALAVSPGVALRRGILALAGLVMLVPAWAALKSTEHFSLRELEQVPELTPHQFANLFGDFRYTYSPYVQPVDQFLEDRAGDCDDYAILA